MTTTQKPTHLKRAVFFLILASIFITFTIMAIKGLMVQFDKLHKAHENVGIAEKELEIAEERQAAAQARLDTFNQ